jgi:hypothetical protein
MLRQAFLSTHVLFPWRFPGRPRTDSGSVRARAEYPGSALVQFKIVSFICANGYQV